MITIDSIGKGGSKKQQNCDYGIFEQPLIWICMQNVTFSLAVLSLRRQFDWKQYDLRLNLCASKCLEVWVKVRGRGILPQKLQSLDF